MRPVGFAKVPNRGRISAIVIKQSNDCSRRVLTRQRPFRSPPTAADRDRPTPVDRLKADGPLAVKEVASRQATQLRLSKPGTDAPGSGHSIEKVFQIMDPQTRL